MAYIRFKLVTLTFKALHTGRPPYLSESDLLQNHERIIAGVHNDFRRPPGAVAAFSRFRRRDISDFTYLLTYLLSSTIENGGDDYVDYTCDICQPQGQYWIEYLSTTNNSNYQYGRC